jgi:hypothetical protein
MTTGTFTYRAFLSYSHLDEPWGNSLYRALAKYQIAADKIGRETAIGRVPMTLGPIYRDSDRHGVDGSPNGQTLAELDASLFLIVVCSPNAARSNYLNEEIRHFRATRGAGNLIGMVIDGERDDPVREFRPAALRLEAGSDGKPVTERGEPLIADVRAHADGRRLAFEKIVAAMIGLPLGEIETAVSLRPLFRASGQVLMVQGAMATAGGLIVAALSPRFWLPGLVCAGLGLVPLLVGLSRYWGAREDWLAIAPAYAGCTRDDFVALCAHGGISGAERDDWIDLFMRAARDAGTRKADEPERIKLNAFIRDARRLSRVAPATLALRGHDETVFSAAFSPDGRRVLTASADSTARIWDAETLEPTAVLNGHGESVLSAVFSPNGRHVATGSVDRTARIWDAATQAQVAVIGGHDSRVVSVSFSPEGRRIVTASGTTAQIWDAGTWTLIGALKGHEAELHGAAFSPDGTRIITAARDGTIRIWDAATQTQIAAIKRTGWSSAVFSPDGRHVLTTDGFVARMWDAGMQAEIAVFQRPESDARSSSAAFAPDGKRVVTVGYKTARIWDAATQAQIVVLKGHESSVHSAFFSPDGRSVVTASMDKTARIWDAATGFSRYYLPRVPDPD